MLPALRRRPRRPTSAPPDQDHDDRQQLDDAVTWLEAEISRLGGAAKRSGTALGNAWLELRRLQGELDRRGELDRQVEDGPLRERIEQVERKLNHLDPERERPPPRRRPWAGDTVHPRPRDGDLHRRISRWSPAGGGSDDDEPGS